MKSSEDLKIKLRSIDHRGYPAYKDLKGQYDFGGYVLSIDHVQGDPFASPSRLPRLADSDAEGPLFLLHYTIPMPKESLCRII